MELKTKGAGREEAGRGMIDSNTSMPSILTLKHLLLFLRFVLTDRIYLYLPFRQVFGAKLWLSDLHLSCL